jgi:hypothetical protein
VAIETVLRERRARAAEFVQLVVARIAISVVSTLGFRDRDRRLRDAGLVRIGDREIDCPAARFSKASAAWSRISRSPI